MSILNETSTGMKPTPMPMGRANGPLAALQGPRWRRTLAAWGLSLWTGAAVFGWSAPAAAQMGSLPDFTELVERVGPSVVNIRTTVRPTRSGRA